MFCALDGILSFFFFALLISLALPLFGQDFKLVEKNHIESALVETDYLLQNCIPPHLLTLVPPLLDCRPSTGLDQNVIRIEVVFPDHLERLYEKNADSSACFTLQRVLSKSKTVGILQVEVCS